MLLAPVAARCQRFRRQRNSQDCLTKTPVAGPAVVALARDAVDDRPGVKPALCKLGACAPARMHRCEVDARGHGRPRATRHVEQMLGRAAYKVGRSFLMGEKMVNEGFAMEP